MDIVEISDPDFVDKISTKLIQERSITFDVFMQSLRHSLICSDRNERVKAMECIKSVLNLLPIGFLNHSQAELLLHFFLDRIEDSSLALLHDTIISILNRIVCTMQLVPSGIESKIFDRLFVEMNVRAYSAKSRLELFEILDYLMRYHLDAMRRLGADLVISFIKAVVEEQDPHCTRIVFRIYRCIAENIALGPTKEEFFDFIASYFPIDYRPESMVPYTNSVNGNVHLTREVLISSFEDCLLASNQFADPVYNLVIDNLMLDDIHLETKEEICSFLEKACYRFPASVTYEHLNDLLGAIRAVLLSTTKKAESKSAYRYTYSALRAIVKKVTENFEESLDAIECVCSDLLENCEPFVLQAQLGLMERSLDLIDVVVDVDERAARICLPQVLHWLVLICKGDSCSSVLGKREVVADGFRCLPNWLKRLKSIARNFDATVRVCDMFIDLLSGNVQYLQDTALSITRYSVAEILLDIVPNRKLNFAIWCESLLEKSSDCCNSDNEELRNSCSAFVTRFSKCCWFESIQILNRKLSRDEVEPVPILFSLISNSMSFDYAMPHIVRFFQSASFDCYEHFIVNVFRNISDSSGGAELRKSYIIDLLDILISKCTSTQMEAVANCMQRIGLLIDDESERGKIIEMMIDRLKKHRLACIRSTYLFILQTDDVSYFNQVIQLLEEEKGGTYDEIEYIILFMGAVLNKCYNSNLLPPFNEKTTRWRRIDVKRYEFRLCTSLMLAGHNEGLLHFRDLVKDAVANAAVWYSEVFQEFKRAFDFESNCNDPIKCRYKTTVAWRQRLFCQLLPIVTEAYAASKETGEKNSRLILSEMMVSILAMAQDISAYLVAEFAELIPLLDGVLYIECDSVSATVSLLNALIHILNSLAVKGLNNDLISKFITRLLGIMNDNPPLEVVLKCLKCFQILALRWPQLSIFKQRDSVINLLVKTSGSHKRLARAAAADIRNLWEVSV